jgi:hypothetical protein
MHVPAVAVCKLSTVQAALILHTVCVRSMVAVDTHKQCFTSLTACSLATTQWVKAVVEVLHEIICCQFYASGIGCHLQGGWLLWLFPKKHLPVCATTQCVWAVIGSWSSSSWQEFAAAAAKCRVNVTSSHLTIILLLSMATCTAPKVWPPHGLCCLHSSC